MFEFAFHSSPHRLLALVLAAYVLKISISSDAVAFAMCVEFDFYSPAHRLILLVLAACVL